MSIEKTFQKLFNITDEVWEKHVNPWSVWTRYPCLLLLFIAIWSRIWIGWWCLIPVIMICVWIWGNPRVFGRPASTDNWASKAVLGERVLLSPPKSGIPAHHKKAIYALKILMCAGFVPALIGLVILNPLMAVSGLVITILGKTWFLDRMVWLYQDLMDDEPEYKTWLY